MVSKKSRMDVRLFALQVHQFHYVAEDSSIQVLLYKICSSRQLFHFHSRDGKGDCAWVNRGIVSDNFDSIGKKWCVMLTKYRVNTVTNTVSNFGSRQHTRIKLFQILTLPLLSIIIISRSILRNVCVYNRSISILNSLCQILKIKIIIHFPSGVISVSREKICIPQRKCLQIINLIINNKSY